VISRVKGTLLTRDLSAVEVETAGGVVYEVEIPLSVAEGLPAVGQPIELLTVHVVREDSAALYGFLKRNEKELFKRLLTASGVGAKLALAMLSTYSASRLARALAERDLPALTQVSGVGKKTAERMALELSEKVRDLALATDSATEASPAIEAAVSALVALGYSFGEADAAVREALRESPEQTAEELIRNALAKT
jgi:Holliday junction DNA helicase RuvA